MNKQFYSNLKIDPSPYKKENSKKLLMFKNFQNIQSDKNLKDIIEFEKMNTDNNLENTNKIKQNYSNRMHIITPSNVTFKNITNKSNLKTLLYDNKIELVNSYKNQNRDQTESNNFLLNKRIHTDQNEILDKYKDKQIKKSPGNLAIRDFSYRKLSSEVKNFQKCQIKSPIELTKRKSENCLINKCSQSIMKNKEESARNIRSVRMFNDENQYKSSQNLTVNSNQANNFLNKLNLQKKNISFKKLNYLINLNPKNKINLPNLALKSNNSLNYKGDGDQFNTFTVKVSSDSSNKFAAILTDESKEEFQNSFKKIDIKATKYSESLLNADEDKNLNNSSECKHFNYKNNNENLTKDKINPKKIILRKITSGTQERYEKNDFSCDNSIKYLNTDTDINRYKKDNYNKNKNSEKLNDIFFPNKRTRNETEYLSKNITEDTKINSFDKDYTSEVKNTHEHIRDDDIYPKKLGDKENSQIAKEFQESKTKDFNEEDKYFNKISYNNQLHKHKKNKNNNNDVNYSSEYRFFKVFNNTPVKTNSVRKNLENCDTDYFHENRKISAHKNSPLKDKNSITKIKQIENKNNISKRNNLKHLSEEKVLNNMTNLNQNTYLSNRRISKNDTEQININAKFANKTPIIETKESVICNSNNSIINSFIPQEKLMEKFKNTPTPGAISVSTLISNKNVPITISNIELNFSGYEPTKCSSKPANLIRAYAANTYQGLIRKYNEDRVSIILNIAKTKNFSGDYWPKISFFGIYDGHGGCNCADFLKDKLHTFIITDENFPKNPIEAIKNGFKKAESEFIEKYAMNEENKLLDKSGSCAIIALMVDEDCYVANVGDSRALLSNNRGRDIRVLTCDHKPNEENENKRIIENGGKIYQTQTPANILNLNLENNTGNIILSNQMLIGPFRVFPGRLSVSRTFGDVEAKHPKLNGLPGVVIATPDISTFKINKETDFIFLGCDGIFDQISNKECIDGIWMAIEDNNREDKLNLHCALGVDLIMKTSLVRRTLDNITCLLVAFDNMEKIILNNNKSLTENTQIYSSFNMIKNLESKVDILSKDEIFEINCKKDPCSNRVKSILSEDETNFDDIYMDSGIETKKKNKIEFEKINLSISKTNSFKNNYEDNKLKDMSDKNKLKSCKKNSELLNNNFIEQEYTNWKKLEENNRIENGKTCQINDIFQSPIRIITCEKNNTSLSPIRVNTINISNISSIKKINKEKNIKQNIDNKNIEIKNNNENHCLNYSLKKSSNKKSKIISILDNFKSNSGRKNNNYSLNKKLCKEENTKNFKKSNFNECNTNFDKNAKLIEKIFSKKRYQIEQQPRNKGNKENNIIDLFCGKSKKDNETHQSSEYSAFRKSFDINKIAELKNKFDNCKDKIKMESKDLNILNKISSFNNNTKFNNERCHTDISIRKIENDIIAFPVLE